MACTAPGWHSQTEEQLRSLLQRIIIYLRLSMDMDWSDIPLGIISVTQAVPSLALTSAIISLTRFT